MKALPLRGIRGFLIDAPRSGALRGVRDGAVLFEHGRIAAAGPFSEVSQKPEAANARWLHSAECVIIPGLVDLGVSLPHFAAAGRAADPGSAWADQIGYPLERNFSGAVAREQAPLFFEILARHGTTQAIVGGGWSEACSDAVFAAAAASGLRIVTGRLIAAESTPRKATGRNGSAGLEQCERLCRRWHRHDNGRLKYAFMLRSLAEGEFAFLGAAADFARGLGAYFQVALPAAAHLPAWLAATGGLCGNRTFCAGGNALTSADLALIAQRAWTLTHAPASDVRRIGPIFPLGAALDCGVRVGFASGVGPGPDPNLWHVMKMARELQFVRASYEPEIRVPTEAELFHLATLGGATALGHHDTTGTIDIGKDADLVVLDLAHVLPYGRSPRMLANLSAEDIISLLVQRGGPAAVVETFVRARSVYRAPAPLLL